MNSSISASGTESSKRDSALTDRPRLLALDALRQIAAMVVFVQHFATVFELHLPSYLRRGGPFDANSAVVLFFVLSGYVLARSLRNERAGVLSYVKFGIRRVLRLYPMHIAATALAFTVLTWIKQTGGFDQSLKIPVEFLNEPLDSIRQWLLQLTLIHPAMEGSFANPPVWTLMAEARIAIVFPAVAWILFAMPRALAWIFVAAVAGVCLLTASQVPPTVSLLGIFTLGASLCLIEMRGGSLVERPWLWAAGMLVSLCLYSLVRISDEKLIGYYLCSLGAAGFIIGAEHWQPFRKALDSLQRLLRVDISYGIYILHYPIMLAARKWVGTTASSGASVLLLFLVVLLATVLLSLILLVALEKPAIRLGRKLTRTPRRLS